MMKTKLKKDQKQERELTFEQWVSLLGVSSMYVKRAPSTAHIINSYDFTKLRKSKKLKTVI